MDNKLFSPILTAANNIVSSKRTLSKRTKDYERFVSFLDTSNKDLKKIKLPTKKKIENLSLELESRVGGGGSGGNPLDILKNVLLGGGAGLGLRSLFKGWGKFGKFKGNYENIIKNLYKKSNLTKGEKFALRDYERLVGKGKISNNDAAFRALLRNKNMNEFQHLTGHGKGVMGGGFSPEIASQYRQAGRIGGGGSIEAPKGKFGGIPKLGGILNVALAGFDFIGRKGEGQTNLQAGAGAAGGALGGIAGAQAGAVAGAAIGSLFGGVGAVPGAIIGGLIGGFGGGYLGGNIADKLTGADKIGKRLKEQEKKQKEAASNQTSFADIINKFDRVVTKFEKIKFGLTGIKDKTISGEKLEDSDSIEPTDPINTGNTPLSTGLQLEDVESTGGEIPGAPDSGFRTSHRPRHNGNDYFKPVGTPISLIQEGTVTVADMNYDPNGWGSLVEVRHKDGSLSRYAHLSRISVAPGSSISPGQVIGYTGGEAGAAGSGNSEGPHLHFEYLPSGSGQVDPTDAAKMIFRFGGNVKVKAKAKAKAGANQQASAAAPVAPEKGEEIFKKLASAKPGSGETIKVPGVGSIVMGRNFFQQPEKKYFTGSGEQITDPKKVKAFENKLDEFLKNARDFEANKSQVKAQARPQLPPEIALPPTTYPMISEPSVIMVNNEAPQTSSQPQMIPIPIPTGGGGGGVSMGGGLSSGDVVNSFAKLILLTNLSGS